MIKDLLSALQIASLIDALPVRSTWQDMAQIISSTRTTERRHEPRTRVLIRVTMKTEDQISSACIRNISQNGMMVQSALPPAIGTRVRLTSRDLRVEGSVIWRSGRRFGIQTGQSISKNLLQRVTATGDMMIILGLTIALVLLSLSAIMGQIQATGLLQ